MNRPAAGSWGVSVVVPTVGRASLADTLRALAPGARPPAPAEVLVVDDRARPEAPLPVPELPGIGVRVLRGPATGPAAARNRGWRAAGFRWVAFLDDDVVPDPGWFGRLVADLRRAENGSGAEVGGVQGRVRVPLPGNRRPTDWERSTAGLATAKWITADMAYRQGALLVTGGFDERFRRAYREDAELAYRVRRAGFALRVGERTVAHPVRSAPAWISLRTQRGNADDALLRRMYGRRWRQRLQVPPGRRPRHVATSVAAVTAVAALAADWVGGGNGRRRARVITLAAAGWWGYATAEFAWARIAPGPRTAREVAVMAATSVAIPPLATLHWLRGWWSRRGARPLGPAS